MRQTSGFSFFLPNSDYPVIYVISSKAITKQIYLSVKGSIFSYILFYLYTLDSKCISEYMRLCVKRNTTTLRHIQTNYIESWQLSIIKFSWLRLSLHIHTLMSTVQNYFTYTSIRRLVFFTYYYWSYFLSYLLVDSWS